MEREGEPSIIADEIQLSDGPRQNNRLVYRSYQYSANLAAIKKKYNQYESSAFCFTFCAIVMCSFIGVYYFIYPYYHIKDTANKTITAENKFISDLSPACNCRFYNCSVILSQCRFLTSVSGQFIGLYYTKNTTKDFSAVCRYKSQLVILESEYKIRQKKIVTARRNIKKASNRIWIYFIFSIGTIILVFVNVLLLLFENENDELTKLLIDSIDQ